MRVHEHTAGFGHYKAKRLVLKSDLLVWVIAAGAGGITLGAILGKAFSDNGFRLASQLAWRYTCFAFFAALALVPMNNILARFHAGFSLSQDFGRRLIWGFCASYSVYLLSILLPNVVHPSAGALLTVFFSTAVIVVMAFATVPFEVTGPNTLMGEKFRRTMLGTAMIYFWLNYSLIALARILGPHRPDWYFTLSLSLMIAALMIRFVDRVLWAKPPSSSNERRALPAVPAAPVFPGGRALSASAKRDAPILVDHEK